MTQALLELDRRYARVIDETASEDHNEVLRTLGAGFRSRPWTRAQLVEQPQAVSVVLGEAGMGKTSEFALLEADWQRTGRFACRLPVADLAGCAVLEDLAAPDACRRWLGSEEEGLFLLDAIDEAELGKHRIVPALRRLLRLLGHAADRARLLLSCRVTDWQLCGGAEALRSVFGDGSEDEPSFLLTQLLPLSVEDVRRLAGSFGCRDFEAFITELERCDALSYAARPGDVEGLVEHWNAKGAIGSLSEITEALLVRRLMETNSDARGASLSLDRARDGARRLAGYAALQGGLTFSVPARRADVSEPADVSTEQTLSDWSRPEQQALLSLAVFDEATFGRVRFHHRNSQDYLAVEWLVGLHARGRFPWQKLLSLLIVRLRDRDTIPLYVRQVVAWLVTRYTDSPLGQALFERVLEIEPELLMLEGDARSLDISLRKRILEAFAERYQDRGSVIGWLDRSPLARFAAPSLAETVGELLLREDAEPELQRTLLWLAMSGGMRTLLSQLRDLALSSEADPSIRGLAIQAMRTIGAEGSLGELRPLLADLDRLPLPLIQSLILNLYPGELSTDELLTLLARFEDSNSPRERLLDVIAYGLPPLLETTAERQELRRALTAFVAGSRDIDDLAQIQRPQLSPLLTSCAQLAAREVRDQPCREDWDEGMLDLLMICSRRHGPAVHPFSNSVSELAEALRSCPGLRRQMFWHRVERRARERGRPTQWYEVIAHRGLPELSGEDLDWLAEDARDRPDVRDRLLCFDWIICGSFVDDDLERRRRLAEDLAAENEDLRRRFERRQRPRSARSEAEIRLELTQRAYQLREQRERGESLEALLERLPGIRSGEDVNALWWLYRMTTQRQMLNILGDVGLERIAEDYGDEIQEAFVDGVQQLWRRHDVGPEEANNEQDPIRILGLVGVRLSVQNGERLSDLPEDLQRRCVRIATRELNGFPEWLDEIATASPTLVGEELGRVIEAERPSMVRDEEPGRSPTILAHIRCASPEVQQVGLPVVWRILQDFPLRNKRCLVQGLEIVLGRVDREPLRELAERRVCESESHPDVQQVWWWTWWALGPTEALDNLEERLQAIESTSGRAEASSYVLGLAGDESVCYRHAQQLADDLAVPALERLAPLLFEHLPPEGDRLPNGQMVRLETRHFAGRCRDSAMSALLNLDSASSRDAIRRWLEDERMAPVHDYLRERLETNERSAGDCAPLAWHEVAELTGGHGSSARLDDAGLFRLITNLLVDIDYEWRGDDYQFLGGLTDKDLDEVHYQPIVARELQGKSGDRFSVEREPEVADRNRMDIKVSVPGCGGVAIEMKLVSKKQRSYRNLSEGLSEQLAGLYLKDRRRRHGIYLLIDDGRKARWKHPATGEFLDFRGLLTHLQREADELVQNHRDQIDELKVLGLVACAPKS